MRARIIVQPFGGACASRQSQPGAQRPARRAFGRGLSLCLLILLLGAGASAVRGETGKDWVQACANTSMTLRLGHTCIAYGGKLWVFGGVDMSHYQSNPQYLGDAWSSNSDGTSWNQVQSFAFAPRAWHTSLVFQNKMWVIGGNFESQSGSNTQDACWSTDGIAWHQATDDIGFWLLPSSRCVEFKSQIWAVNTGYDGTSPNPTYNEVWTSTDGAQWTRIAATCPFTPRIGFSFGVFNGRLWVMGGTVSAGFVPGGNPPQTFNDVWSTTDGLDWRQETTAAAFSPRYSANLQVGGGKMWLLGGSDYSLPNLLANNEIWSSSDGKAWTEVNAAYAGGAIGPENCAILNDKLWVIGDKTGSSPSPAMQAWYTTVDPAATVNAAAHWSLY